MCESCAAPGEVPAGATLAAALGRRLGDLATLEVELGGCMNQCGAPVALALRAEGRPAYLFAGLDPAGDLDDAEALCRLYHASGRDGIADARPAGRLRHCLVGRIPA